MRTTTGWLALLLTAGVALAPTGVRCQEVPPADPVIPLPLYHDRPETGGFYAAGEFVFFRQTNPLKQQVVAIRGLLDFDGSITEDLTGTLVTPVGGTPVILPGTARVGTFYGSRNPALDVEQVASPETFQPGFRLTAGWRFRDGTAVEFTWMRLQETKFSAVATLAPPGLFAGNILEETFLFSPVFNFPNDFAGPQQKLAIGNPNAAYGIWNGATVMSLEFIQRFSEYDLNVRVPIFQTDYCRCYGLFGPRYISMWERFRWRTVSADFNGVSGQDDVALYNNIVSNQMWGVDAGFGSELYLGKGFSISGDVRAAGLIDFARLIAKYERADFATGSKRARRDYNFVPEVDGNVNLWWYPIEGVQVRIGYNAITLFDTFSSKNPVSFNFGGPDPDFSKNTYRFLDGFNAGIGFIF